MVLYLSLSWHGRRAQSSDTLLNIFLGGFYGSIVLAVITTKAVRSIIATASSLLTSIIDLAVSSLNGCKMVLLGWSYGSVDQGACL